MIEVMNYRIYNPKKVKDFWLRIWKLEKYMKQQGAEEYSNDI